jgi:hypothetical protein
MPNHLKGAAVCWWRRSSPPQLLVFVLFALSTLPFIFQYPNDTLECRDEFKHIIAARSIAEGTGFSTPGNSQYPPGWAIVLAVTLLLSGGSFAPAHVLTSLLAWFIGPLTYLYFRKRVSPWAALCIGLLSSTHWLNVWLGDTLFSEPAFIAAWWCALLLSDFRHPRGEWLKAVLVGGAVTIAMAFRTAGLALWAGFLLHALTRKRTSPRELAVASAPWSGLTNDTTGRSKSELSEISLPFRRWKNIVLEITSLSCIPLLYSITLNFANPHMAIRPDKGYGRQFFTVRTDAKQSRLTGLVSRTVSDFPRHLSTLRDCILPRRWRRSKLLVYMLLFGFTLSAAGLFEGLKRRRDPHPWVTACYMVLIFLWPYFYARFFLPLFPLFLFYGTSLLLQVRRSDAHGSLCWLTRLWSLLQRWFVPVFLAALLGASALSIAGAVKHPHYMRELRSARFEALRSAVSIAAERGGSIATISMFKVYYFHKKSDICKLMYSPNPEEHLVRIRRARATWLLIERELESYYDRLLKSNPDDFRLIFNRNGVRLYSISPRLSQKKP